MRYVVLLAVWLGEITLIVALGYIWYLSHFNLLVGVASFALLCHYFQEHGLSAWRPSVIRRFLENSKKAGL